MIPYPYQEAGLQALHTYLCNHKDNPCVVIPTGGGKSAFIAWCIERWKKQAPWVRVCILAHRQELIEQNAAELKNVCSELEVGIFSAALKRKDWNADILYASIDSIYQHSGEFRPWDILFVDEAHRIPFRGEGKYRTFIRGSERFNERLRVVGLTATPYRLDGGQLCHSSHILNKICYEANITDLIEGGYLCQLRSKVGESKPDVTGLRKSSGDYVTKALAKATNKADLVERTVAELVRIINQEQRKSVLVFCVDVAHCIMVATELEKHGILAPYITGKTKQEDRERAAEWFRSGKLRAICNVNVYTEGFNAKNVDCIALLRPTLSAGLYSQMVGRGLRTSPEKRDCLVLDFAGCIEEHGPIDLIGGRPVVLAKCAQCREAFSRALGSCPSCGWKVPKKEIERLETAEREKRMHADKASRAAILSGQPVIYDVDDVEVFRHVKIGFPDSLRVQYRSGDKIFREWICLDHPNAYPAQLWWRERFGGNPKKHTSVDEAMENMFLNSSLKEWTKTITVVRRGKYDKIINYNQTVA